MDSNTQQKRDELVARLRKANDITSANAVLSWDQSTYMPPAGAAARARQMATLEGLAHEAATDPAIGRLLDELQPYADSLPPDDDDAALVRVARRSYERRTKVPAEFAAAFADHVAETYSLWAEARPANDFRPRAARLGEDAEDEPAVCQLLPRLPAYRRSFDRQRRLRHERGADRSAL